jgi:hypothetical protein
VYQGRGEAGGQESVFALLAPGLVGLAVALLIARLLPLAATRTGGAAIRAGRPDVALTALHLARRPGTHRVFAVLAVVAAVFTTTTFAWHTASVGWARRAAQELGAPRVLTVRAANSSALLAAVRAADPDGRYAMAVARTDGPGREPGPRRDTTRLAAMPRCRPYGFQRPAGRAAARPAPPRRWLTGRCGWTPKARRSQGRPAGDSPPTSVHWMELGTVTSDRWPAAGSTTPP